MTGTCQAEDWIKADAEGAHLVRRVMSTLRNNSEALLVSVA